VRSTTSLRRDAPLIECVAICGDSQRGSKPHAPSLVIPASAHASLGKLRTELSPDANSRGGVSAPQVGRKLRQQVSFADDLRAEQRRDAAQQRRDAARHEPRQQDRSARQMSPADGARRRSEDAYYGRRGRDVALLRVAPPLPPQRQLDTRERARPPPPRRLAEAAESLSRFPLRLTTPEPPPVVVSEPEVTAEDTTTSAAADVRRDFERAETLRVASRFQSMASASVMKGRADAQRREARRLQSIAAEELPSWAQPWLDTRRVLESCAAADVHSQGWCGEGLGWRASVPRRAASERLDAVRLRRLRSRRLR